MSSPTSRRTATPRRTTQRSSEAPQSSPTQPGYGPEDQLRDEASQGSRQSQSQSQETPRANRTSQDTSQNALTSSPLFFQSSPANGSINRSTTNGSNGIGISSPLRQQSAAPSDGGRTPRASGQTMGGGRSQQKRDLLIALN